MTQPPRSRPQIHSPFQIAAQALLFGLLLTLPSAAFAAGGNNQEPALLPDITFVVDGQKVETLEIGKHLDIHLSGGSPLTTYGVYLRDDFDQIVAMTSTATDSTGESEIIPLWTETGIVGCDPWFTVDPLNYLFANLLQAEAILDGRTFEVVVYQGQSSSRRALPLEANLAQPVAYTSDQFGCKRNVFLPWDDLHLSVVHTPAVAQPAWIFVAPSQVPWKAGDPIVDVSSDGANYTVIPASDPLWTYNIGQTPGIGFYDVILRWGFDQIFLFNPGTDTIPGTSIPSMDSRTYKPCGIYCPPP